ncbi:MAG: hypothetical protein IPP74_03220 [Alphaproteobacteria bacterium]|nr:hypothetical protein [Alphaproteobacteria bacterium]
MSEGTGELAFGAGMSQTGSAMLGQSLAVGAAFGLGMGAGAIQTVNTTAAQAINYNYLLPDEKVI